MLLLRHLSLTLFGLAGVVQAQTGWYETDYTAFYTAPSSQTSASSPAIMTSSSTSSAAAATHTIKVGSKEDPHQYSPHNVTAAAGDVIVFQFYPRNHSVVKADYNAPCVPASNNVFFSGIYNNFNEQNGQAVGPPPTWNLVVNDTQPTFFYCTAIDSCIGNGMVGVINPNASMTWETQYEKAKGYPYMLVPGQSMPAEGTLPPSTATASPTGSSNSQDEGSSGTHLSAGAIAGIVVGAVAFLVILVALFFTLGRNRVYKQWMSSQDGRTERTARWALFHGEPYKQKSEMGSSAQHTADHNTLPSSPDPTQRTFSPPPHGHWSWDSPTFAQYPPPQPPQPTELDANDSMRRGV